MNVAVVTDSTSDVSADLARDFGIDVVPFDLEMAADERTLLISGPNTGGKHVLLKALGLFSALVQSGIPAPVAGGSSIATFADIYADVGDEQSVPKGVRFQYAEALISAPADQCQEDSKHHGPQRMKPTRLAHHLAL